MSRLRIIKFALFNLICPLQFHFYLAIDLLNIKFGQKTILFLTQWWIFRKNLYEKADGSETNRILIRLYDLDNRELHVYASVSLIRGGALSINFWVPFWLINRSGIPLIVKQDAAFKESAGQVSDHEKAKDRNPLMFAFVEEGCPKQLMARVGKKMVSEPGFKPQFSRPFSLAPGIQSLKLLLTHNQDATRLDFSFYGN